MSSSFATEEWAQEAGSSWPLLPPAPGATGDVTLAVAVGPRREVAIHWRYEQGRALTGGAGAAPPSDPDRPGPRPSGLVLTLSVADATDVLGGVVAPSVAFMRGRLKAAGDGGLLLAVLASTEDPAFEDWRRRVGGAAPA